MIASAVKVANLKGKSLIPLTTSLFIALQILSLIASIAFDAVVKLALGCRN